METDLSGFGGFPRHPLSCCRATKQRVDSATNASSKSVTSYMATTSDTDRLACKYTNTAPARRFDSEFADKAHVKTGGFCRKSAGTMNNLTTR